MSEAAKWAKRIGIDAGAGTLPFAHTLLKVSYSRDQRSRTGIFILIATGGTATGTAHVMLAVSDPPVALLLD